MSNHTPSGRALLAAAGLALAGLLGTTACDDDDPVAPEPGPDVEQQLEQLRQATEAYHDVEAAEEDGWDVRFPAECLTHSELGGMGVHQLDEDLVDDEVAVTEPELLVYEPREDGTLEFVALEYIVPFEIRPSDASPPELFGREFAANETYQVWALHTWAWKGNPNGTFEDFNPTVTCEHADTVRTFPEP